MLYDKFKEVRIAACDLLIAFSSRGHNQVLMDSGLLQDIIKLISLDENVFNFSLFKIQLLGAMEADKTDQVC